MKITGIKKVSTEYWIPNQKDTFRANNVCFLSDYKQRKKKNIEFVTVEISAPSIEESKPLLEQSFVEITNILVFITNFYWRFEENLEVFPSQLKIQGILKFISQYHIAHVYWKDNIHIVNSEFRRKLKTLLSKPNHNLQEPLSFWRAGLESHSLFEEFLDYYKVIEYFKGSQIEIDKWVYSIEPSSCLLKTKKGNRISTYTMIRNRVSHRKKNRSSLNPTKAEDIEEVKKHLQGIKKLAKMIIEENIKPIS